MIFLLCAGVVYITEKGPISLDNIPVGAGNSWLPKARNVSKFSKCHSPLHGSYFGQ